MGATHFLTKTLPRVNTEMSLHVLAYNMKRAMQILGTRPAHGGNQGLETLSSLANTPEPRFTGIRVAAVAHLARSEQRSHTASTEAV